MCYCVTTLQVYLLFYILFNSPCFFLLSQIKGQRLDAQHLLFITARPMSKKPRFSQDGNLNLARFNFILDIISRFGTFGFSRSANKHLSSRSLRPLQQRGANKEQHWAAGETLGFFHPAGEETRTGCVKSDARRRSTSAAISADDLQSREVLNGRLATHQIQVVSSWEASARRRGPSRGQTLGSPGSRGCGQAAGRAKTRDKVLKFHVNIVSLLCLNDYWIEAKSLYEPFQFQTSPAHFFNLSLYQEGCNTCILFFFLFYTYCANR